MKLLISFGIIIIFVLLFLIYKKSKGIDDFMNYSIIEGVDDFDPNAKIRYVDLALADMDVDKLGEIPSNISAVNKEKGKLVGTKKDIVSNNKERFNVIKGFGNVIEGLGNIIEGNAVNSYTNTTVPGSQETRINTYERKKNDPGGVLMNPNQATTFLSIEDKGSKSSSSYTQESPKPPIPRDFDVEKTDVNATGIQNTIEKKMPNDEDTQYIKTDIGDKLNECKKKTTCGELSDNGYCGYCGDDGKGNAFFSFGTKHGPLTHICKDDKWAFNERKCIEIQDKQKCDIAQNDCANIPKEHEMLCGYCPSTGKVIPYKTGASGAKTPKYEVDKCSYTGSKAKGSILSGKDCLTFSETNPCITPYHSTGPHSEACLKSLWKLSRCEGDKPYNKTFDDLRTNKTYSLEPKSLENKGDYKDIQKKMENLYLDMNEEDIITAIKSTQWCNNAPSDLNPCDSKYYGSGEYTVKNKPARELCRERIWDKSGCTEDGDENPSLIKKVKGESSPEYKKILNGETSSEYQARIMNLPRIANKSTSISGWSAKKAAYNDCYGKDPAPLTENKPGFYVSYKLNNLKLWGYLIEQNMKGAWRILWVAKQLGKGTQINRKDYKAIKGDTDIKKLKKIDDQRFEFGWPGLPATAANMKGLPDYIEADDIVTEKDGTCKPGITMCGNSCNAILSKLFNDYPQPRDCVVSEWSAFTECSKECVDESGTGKQTQARYIITKSGPGGKSCPDEKDLIKEQDCNDKPCLNTNFVQETFNINTEGFQEGLDPRYQQVGKPDVLGVKGKYVQISHTSYIIVQEIEVYDDKNKNVALASNGGISSASDIMHGKPFHMNNGKKDWTQSLTNSVHTHSGGNRWIRITLPEMTNITRIVVYNRPDCCQTYLQGASLIIFDDRMKEQISFTLNSKRKQVFHPGSSKLYNVEKKNKKAPNTGFSCNDFDIPVGTTDTEVTSIKTKKSNNNTNNIGEGTCIYKHFEKSKTHKEGGDCVLDRGKVKWYGFDSKNWSLDRCAKNCLNTNGCNRFTFGKSNSGGGKGMGCIISSGVNDGNGTFCPITTDRYAAQGLKWNGTSNYWGGQVYDKKGVKGGKAYELVGDFQDSNNGTNRRGSWNWAAGPKMGKGTVLSTTLARSTLHNDARTCASMCKNYKFFGLQGWGRCYCSNNMGGGRQCHDPGSDSSYTWEWNGKSYFKDRKDCKASWMSNRPANRVSERAYKQFSWYGGYRNKIFKTPKGQKEGSQEWKKCANEGGNCNVGGGAMFRYGEGDKWTIKGGDSGGIKCNEAEFTGDPSPGKDKICEYKKY